jgi:type IX secretion system PorP/SprF family membrane protein
MIRKQLVCFLLFLTPLMVMSQQLPLLSHYYLNGLLYNPAFTGTAKSNQLFLVHRDQWNLNNGPVVNGLTADKDFKDGKVGLGITIFNQKAGLSDLNKIKINYAYHQDINEVSRIHFGVSGGIAQSKFNLSKAVVSDVNDPMLTSQADSKISPDFDGGVAYSLKDFTAGVSVSQLQGSAFSKDLTAISLRRQYSASLSYDLKFGEENLIKVVPLLLVKNIDGAPLQLDFNTSICYKDLLWIGGSYRKGNAIGANAAVKLKQFRVGYCFEHNKISSYSGATNEISLAYVFNTYKQSKPSSAPVVKGTDKESDKAELERLRNELAEKEEELVKHEKEIYALIDELYNKASREESLTIQEKLDKVERTQKEVNKIKQELREYNNQKNVEIYNLKKRIETLQKKQQ